MVRRIVIATLPISILLLLVATRTPGAIGRPSFRTPSSSCRQRAHDAAVASSANDEGGVNNVSGGSGGMGWGWSRGLSPRAEPPPTDIAASGEMSRKVDPLQRALQRIRHVGEGSKTVDETLQPLNDGGGMGDPKNIPVYLIQSVVVSEALARLGKIWDPSNVIVVVNLLVLAAWEAAKEDNEMTCFMRRNFLLHSGPDCFKPRQLLLHGFSHKDRDHAISNLSALAAMAPLVRRCMSKWSLFPFNFYVFSIYISSLFDDLVYCPLLKDDDVKTMRFLFWSFDVPKRRASLGASGAVSAVMTFCGLACPNEKYLKSTQEKEHNSMSVAAPMWMVASTAFLGDIIYPMTAKGKQSNIGYGSHIGGSLFGASVYIINRLWGNKLRGIAHKSAAFFMKLIPSKSITRNMKKSRKFCNEIATKFWIFIPLTFVKLAAHYLVIQPALCLAMGALLVLEHALEDGGIVE
eukprot:CAMPEP_0181120832 /NCGR_PEP_ID=MMETSP1071-20121207/24384_1 /TAXON_ID=35127 /ORGANISM="Thalassiosira sp., Strain NH16" /LENGTH=462 /DNA_ID=CAMNT_0023205549 /DNA_START=29 /DNA_END=1417 /DNA_ORIENTATION=+